eukprot:11162124-Lingulodinium_polyedra.AAC.1
MGGLGGLARRLAIHGLGGVYTTSNGLGGVYTAITWLCVYTTIAWPWEFTLQLHGLGSLHYNYM